MKIRMRSSMILAGGMALAMMLTACAQEKTVEVPESKPPVVKETTVPPLETPKGLESYDTFIKRVHPDAKIQVSEADQQKSLEAFKKQVKEGMPLKDLCATFDKKVVTMSPAQATKLADSMLQALQKQMPAESAKLDERAIAPGYMKDFYKEGERVNRQYGRLTLEIDAIQDPDVKKEAQEAREKGYALCTSEGMIYYVVDYTRLAQYRDFYTPDFALLMTSLAYDTLDPLMADGSIRVSRENLAARAQLLENGLSLQQKSLYRDGVRVRYLEHLDLLFYGSNNSPAYDYETNRISEEHVDFLKKHAADKNGKTNELLAKYVDILGEHKGIITDEVRKKVEALMANLRSELGLTKEGIDRYRAWEAGDR